jgi:outer membrane murein-binding lipoprotein Lpp
MFDQYHAHHHYHVPTKELQKLMADVNELNAKVDAIQTNLNETADEVARIGVLITEIRAAVAGGIPADQADALSARLDEVVARTQAVEDSLRSTT